MIVNHEERVRWLDANTAGWMVHSNPHLISGQTKEQYLRFREELDDEPNLVAQYGSGKTLHVGWVYPHGSVSNYVGLGLTLEEVVADLYNAVTEES